MPDMIDREKDQIIAMKYQINSLVFSKGEEKIEMKAENIISFEWLCDYEFNVRTLLKLALSVDIRQKQWILQNRKEITVKVEMDKVGLDTDSEQLITGPEPVFNNEFNVYLNDDDDAADTKGLEESMQANEGDEFKTTDIEDVSYMESDNAFDIYLFEPTLLNASNKTFNKVFTKAPLQHMIGELLTETGHKKVIMSPLENDEVYQEVLVPSGPAYKGLSYLDQHFGFYKRGSIIFYDIDRLYIINPNGKVTAKEKDEWTETVFLVTPNSDTSPGNGMVRKEDEKVFYINVPEQSVSPQRPSMATNANVGSEAKVVITDDITIDSVDADQSYMNQRNEYIQYAKKGDNKFITSITQARMEENECVQYINGENFDVSAFKPNKSYKVIYSDAGQQEKYGKYRYRIAYAYHYFKIEGSEYMSASHQIVLKKCSDLPESSNN